MEEFEVIVTLNTTSPTIIQIPSHSNGINWGYYIKKFRFECTTITSGNPNTSYSALSISVPYIPICIDNPVQSFDSLGKPLPILAVALPDPARGSNREVYTYDILGDIPVINQLHGRDFITLYMLDITKNLPVTFVNTTPGLMTCNIGGSNGSITTGAICILKFIHLK